MTAKKLTAAMLVTLALLVAALCSYYIYCRQNQVAVLLYHHLLPDEINTNYINPSTLDTKVFEEQMKYLSDMGYSSISADELYEFIVHNRKLPKRSVLITFDDGYLSNIVYGKEILERYGFRAMIFPIIGALPETPEQLDPSIENFISFAQLKEGDGVFEFGSHTCNMHKTDENGNPYLLIKSKEEIEEDIAKSFETKGLKRYFAYPYGKYNGNIKRILKQQGVKLAFTVNGAYARFYSNPLEVPRFSITRDITMEQFASIMR